MEYYFEEFPTGAAGRTGRVFGPVTEEELAELESIALRPLYVHEHPEGEGCQFQMSNRRSLR